MFALAIAAALQQPLPQPKPELPPLPIGHFGGKEYVVEWADWWREHAAWAEKQVVLYPSEVNVSEYAKLARWKSNIWSLLANAHGECNAIYLAGGWFEHPQGEDAMEWLIDEIGAYDFALGIMPQP